MPYILFMLLGLSSGITAQHQDVTWDCADFLSIGSPLSNFSGIWIINLSSLLMEMFFKLMPAKCDSFLRASLFQVYAKINSQRQTYYIKLTLGLSVITCKTC